MAKLYAYGVIHQEDSIDLSVEGVHGGSVYTVDYRSLSAVVSDIDEEDPERTDEAVEAHNEVLGAVMEYDDGRTVVPMQFGMVFKDGRTLKGVMRGASRAFRKALNEIDGTVELGVKLVATGGDVDEAAVADAAQQLTEIAVNETDDDLFSDRLLLNRSYLVDRDDVEAFNDAVEEIETAFDEQLTVQYTGPWAPYNFVDIRIGAEG